MSCRSFVSFSSPHCLLLMHCNQSVPHLHILTLHNRIYAFICKELRNRHVVRCTSIPYECLPCFVHICNAYVLTCESSVLIQFWIPKLNWIKFPLTIRDRIHFSSVFSRYSTFSWFHFRRLTFYVPHSHYM